MYKGKIKLEDFIEVFGRSLRNVTTIAYSGNCYDVFQEVYGKTNDINKIKSWVDKLEMKGFRSWLVQDYHNFNTTKLELELEEKDINITCIFVFPSIIPDSISVIKKGQLSKDIFGDMKDLKSYIEKKFSREFKWFDFSWDKIENKITIDFYLHEDEEELEENRFDAEFMLGKFVEEIVTYNAVEVFNFGKYFSYSYLIERRVGDNIINDVVTNEYKFIGEATEVNTEQSNYFDVVELNRLRCIYVLSK